MADLTNAREQRLVELTVIGWSAVHAQLCQAQRAVLGTEVNRVLVVPTIDKLGTLLIDAGLFTENEVLDRERGAWDGRRSRNGAQG